MNDEFSAHGFRLSFLFADFFKHGMDITGPDQVFPVLRNLAGKNGQVLKSGEVHFQLFHFFLIQGISQTPATKYQIDILVGKVVI